MTNLQRVVPVFGGGSMDLCIWHPPAASPSQESSRSRPAGTTTTTINTTTNTNTTAEPLSSRSRSTRGRTKPSEASDRRTVISRILDVAWLGGLE
ncbi:hypothetical protein VTH82DRAFT_3297 [Thermothelomyces myriococcoides]